MKKILLFLLFSVCVVTILAVDFHLTMSGIAVYKDRIFWEQEGKIIWEVKTSKKVVALTFDDGPSPTFTPRILKVLKKYNAKATFFIIGKQAEKFPQMVTKVALAGHTLGNHMYNHQRISKISKEDLINDMERAQQIIFSLTGSTPKFFRPPDGYYDEVVVEAAQALNYKIILWTWAQDTRDWADLPANKIANKVIKNIKPGDIILFHDQGGDRTNTVEALEIILPVLKEEGYSFITIEELLRERDLTHQ